MGPKGVQISCTSVKLRDRDYYASRLRVAGAAWARLRPMLFSGTRIGPRRKYRLFTTFVLSKLLHGSEVWCLVSEELTKLQRFHDRCLRAMVGLNRWTMHERHITTSASATCSAPRPCAR